MMKSMPRLTKESEQRISAALTKVAALTNAGEDPSNAIVKIATEAQIPHGQVRLMVRAFNNGRSIGHLRSHTSLEEKAASFPLANASDILEQMFPDDHKTTAEEKNASVVSVDYGLSPEGWMHRRAQAARQAMLTKVASDKPPAPYPEDPRRMGKQAVSRLHDMRREYTEVHHAAINAAYGVVNSIEKLAGYFRNFQALPFEAVRNNAQRMWGARADRLMEKVAEHKIVFKRIGNQPHIVEWEKAPYSLIKAALDAADTFIDVRQNLEALAAEHSEKRAETLRPFSEARVPAVITGSVWDNQSQTEKQAVGLLGLGLAGAVGGTARGMAEKLAPKSREEMIQDQMSALSAPAHEDALRAINAKAMVHGMMTNDLVISGYSHEDVLTAYNHLAEIAPRAMQHRVLAQSLIRKYLEQAAALDPFDVDQLLGVESKISARDMPEALTHGNYQVGPMRELGPPIPLRPAEAPKTNIIDRMTEEWAESAKQRKDFSLRLRQEATKQRRDLPERMQSEETLMRMKDRVKHELEGNNQSTSVRETTSKSDESA